MSYLSRRCREIQEEEFRRSLPQRVKEIAEDRVRIRGNINAILYGPMADSFRDDAFYRMREEMFVRHEEVLRARNPMGYTSPMNFRNRGG